MEGAETFGKQKHIILLCVYPAPSTVFIAQLPTSVLLQFLQFLLWVCQLQFTHVLAVYFSLLREAMQVYSSPALSLYPCFFLLLFTELSPALKACAFGHFKLINSESALCPILLKLIGAHPLVRSKKQLPSVRHRLTVL